MGAVFYSSLSWLYWYAPPTQFLNGPSELSWFDALPTTWDESCAVGGDVGQHVVMARRKGDVWYTGAMTDQTARVVDLPLDFLGDGTWSAHCYADGTPSADPRATPVVESTRQVTASDVLQLTLAPSGGQAIRFERA
ncbi:glycoside hydrolase family 97 C-terminal domain-containing protein [Micromonospora sp. SL1-18]|uniref:glycoside hydrolase family 97 C-terminal domain-containing protein n=1 Tax=Micromonospora sp. SL1-18 TaxID=3399128 RepID=UPI003A4E0F35